MKVTEAVTAARRDIKADIRARLSKAPMNEGELADALDCSPARVREALRELTAAGANFIHQANNRLLLHNLVEAGGRLVLKAPRDGRTALGVVSDNHLCNRHSRLDVLNAAYDDFERRGITTVLNAGNWIDGEFKKNRHELLVAGMDNQLDYWIDKTPQRPGITTYFISGKCHEGWYSERECINIGQYAEMKAEKAGRKDLRYIGHIEADIALKCGKGEAVLRMMHPGGGSAYAFSYAPQKIVESFQGGEKPPILIIGHYHKWDYCYPREVHVISAGCTCDQTEFMRTGKMAAHVGYIIANVEQDTRDAHVTGVEVKWTPFYNRGFYERRFD